MVSHRFSDVYLDSDLYGFETNEVIFLKQSRQIVEDRREAHFHS